MNQMVMGLTCYVPVVNFPVLLNSRRKKSSRVFPARQLRPLATHQNFPTFLHRGVK